MQIKRLLTTVLTRRLTHPTENFLIVVCTFSVLILIWFAGINLQLTFEDDVNQYTNLPLTLLYSALLFILLVNCFLFKRNSIKILSVIVTLVIYILMSLIGIIYQLSGYPPRLIRRTIASNGEIISLYQRVEGGISGGDSVLCRSLILQHRVIPGILSNAKVGQEECRPAADRPFNDFPERLR